MFIRRIDDTIALALVQPSFSKDYLKILNEERDELSSFLPWANFAKNEEYFCYYITKTLHDYADGSSFICAIIYNDKVVGSIGITSINYDLEKANIGYWLSKCYRGKGIVTKCTKYLIDVAFNELGLTKIEIKSAVDNLRSRAVPERLGFNLEGIITQAERVKDTLVDQAVYGYQKQNSLTRAALN